MPDPRAENHDPLYARRAEAGWEHELSTDLVRIKAGDYESLFNERLEGGAMNRQQWESKVHPDDRRHVFLALSEAIADPSLNFHVTDYRLLRSDGSVVFIRDRIFIQRQEGIAVRLAGLMQDVSAERARQQRLNLLESVIANATDSVIILESLHASPEGAKIIYVNEAFTAMSGYGLAEVTGKSPALFIGPETNSQQFGLLENAIRERQSCAIEIVNYKKNGDAYWVEFAIAPVNVATTEAVHFILIGRDITERRAQVHEQDKLINELTQNNIDLRQFSYITSHNLRGPIASLLGLCSLLEHFKVEDNTLRQILEGVRKATHMFDDTIKDLTTVLNVRDRTSIPRQELLFDSIYQKALTQSEVMIEYCGAEIRADFENAPSVTYNKAYLESIFSNLITNAIKYRSKGRQLKVNIKTEVSGDHIVMKFSDNGLGIDLKLYKEKMFRLYQRFHDHSEGKGLGLFLIKSQLEALNGSIDIESKLDEGTTFILKFKR